MLNVFSREPFFLEGEPLNALHSLLLGYLLRPLTLLKKQYSSRFCPYQSSLANASLYFGIETCQLEYYIARAFGSEVLVSSLTIQKAFRTQNDVFPGGARVCCGYYGMPFMDLNARAERNPHTRRKIAGHPWKSLSSIFVVKCFLITSQLIAPTLPIILLPTGGNWELNYRWTGALFPVSSFALARIRAK